MTRRHINMFSVILVLSILLGISVFADFLLPGDIPVFPAAEDNSYLPELPEIRFSVTVPASLPIAVSEDGIVTTASSAQIINSSSAAVKVTDILVSGENGWSIVPYNRNMALEKVDSRQIGLRINNAETGEGINNTGGLALIEGEWTIPPESVLSLYYDAVVSACSLPVVGLWVMTLYFVVDWAD